MRGRRPCSCANSSVAARARATAGDRPASSRYTPEIVRITAACRPHTRSNASEISPTVALARAASTANASRLSDGSARRCAAAAADNASRVCRTDSGIPCRAQAFQLRELRRPHRRVVHLEELQVLVDRHPPAVHPDHRLGAAVDPGLGAGRRLLDPQLRDARLDRGRHPAGRLDLGDVCPGPVGQVVGQSLDVVRPAPRVDDLRRARLLLQHQLGVAGDPGGEVGRQCDRLVERVGVQRLGVPLGRSHRLQAGAGDVVEHVLGGQRPARGLAMRAQRQRFRDSSGRTGRPTGSTATARRASWRSP